MFLRMTFFVGGMFYLVVLGPDNFIKMDVFFSNFLAPLPWNLFPRTKILQTPLHTYSAHERRLFSVFVNAANQRSGIPIRESYHGQCFWPLALATCSMDTAFSGLCDGLLVWMDVHRGLKRGTTWSQKMLQKICTPCRHLVQSSISHTSSALHHVQLCVQAQLLYASKICVGKQQCCPYLY